MAGSISACWSSWRHRNPTRPADRRTGEELDEGVDIVVRTHSDTEAAYLRALGGKVQAVHGERELAVQMARYSLRRFGVSAPRRKPSRRGLRGRPYAAAAPRRGSAADVIRGWIRGLATDERD